MRTVSVVAMPKKTAGGVVGTPAPDGCKLSVGLGYPRGDTVTVVDLGRRAVVARVKTGNRPKQPPRANPDSWRLILNGWG